METSATPVSDVLKERINIVSGAFYIPKDDISKPEGDDAHFICEEKQIIGIADGVGGWTQRGVNAGEYARELMLNSANALHTEPKGAVDPKRVLSQAHLNTKLPGSCTACLLSLDGNILRAANLGDSGFMVIRNGDVFYKSSVQQHGFNHPYQLGQTSGDSPSSAMSIKLTVEAGDVIIVGTDGLFDNMFSDEILQWVTQEINQSSDPQLIAWRLAEGALYHSLDRFGDTPFSRASRENGGNHSGGKRDDITVIVALILQDYS